MVNIDASVDDVDIDAFSTARIVFITAESRKSQLFAAANAREAPRSRSLNILVFDDLISIKSAMWNYILII